jgi:hypothetical protein
MGRGSGGLLFTVQLSTNKDISILTVRFSLPVLPRIQVTPAKQHVRSPPTISAPFHGLSRTCLCAKMVKDPSFYQTSNCD